MHNDCSPLLEVVVQVDDQLVIAQDVAPLVVLSPLQYCETMRLTRLMSTQLSQHPHDLQVVAAVPAHDSTVAKALGHSIRGCLQRVRGVTGTRLWSKGNHCCGW